MAFNLYSNLTTNPNLNGNNFGAYMTDAFPRLPIPPVSVALPYTDPLFGTKSYITGPPINLNPVNNYGIKRLNVQTPYANLGINGRQDQLVDIMKQVNDLKNTQQNGSQNDGQNDEDVYRPLTLNSFIDQSNGLSPLQESLQD